MKTSEGAWRRAFRLPIVVAGALFAVNAQAAGPTGAIFTTTPDGTIVNENVRYEAKIEVYLDGGPGPNAPQTAAGLDDGLYVFQVTDPSGVFLLSMDPSKCRVVRVEDGIIRDLVEPSVLGLANSYLVGNKVYDCHVLDAPDGAAGSSGRHDTNTDADHGPPAIVVQLMPFGDTPNPGGVYKAWMEKLESYVEKGGELSSVPVAIRGSRGKECPDFCADRDPGFGPPNTDTKTDNFKVRRPGKPPIPPEISVAKFHDRNANGVLDAGEEYVTGWRVDVTDPTLVTNPVFTPETIVAEPPGLWSFDEENPEGTVQSASFVDGVATLPSPTDPVVVTVAGTSGERHDVLFGNVGLGEVRACKVYDRNANGVADEGEPYVPGWKIVLTGTLANGAPYGPATQLTGADGCTVFGGLLPGDYLLVEGMPPGWFTAMPVPELDVTIASTLDGSTIRGGSLEAAFANFCTGTADFGTKGYWHNKNGLQELTPGDRDYANGLAPYANPSDYFSAGDEPFDGAFMNGDPVDAAFSGDGTLIWSGGTWQSEVSAFLIDSNAGGGGADREQLAQQLLAFIFNARHRLDDPGATLYEPTLGWVSAASIIDDAVAAWGSPDLGDDAFWTPILDGLNNGDAIPFIRFTPCEVSYP